MKLIRISDTQAVNIDRIDLLAVYVKTESTKHHGIIATHICFRYDEALLEYPIKACSNVEIRQILDNIIAQL